MNKFTWCGRSCLATLLIAASGCSLLQAPTNQTKALVRSLEGTVGLKPATNALTFVQNEIMREADGYASVVAQAADGFAAKAGTVEARTEALQWKLQQATAAFVNATGENPNLNAADMVVLATLSRSVIENYWVAQKYGPAALPLLETHRKLEQSAWSVVEQLLTAGQLEDLHKLILNWCQNYPDQRYVGAVRLREFKGVLGKEAFEGQANKAGSVLNLLNIDPLSGLDPAVRAIEQTRYLAERIMYYLERAPTLLSWQVELLSYQVAAQAAPQQVLSNLTSLSQSAAIFADTAQQLPGLVNTQREAAINQLFVGIATERSNILSSLEVQESKLRELLPEVRQTLATGGEMANSLNGAIKSLDTFVRYVSPPDTNPAPASTNSQPFNVLDYGKAATQIGAMSRDLNLLISSANQSATQLVTLSEQATAKADRVVDRAFRLGLLLVVILLAGSVLAALAYRVLVARLACKTTGSSTAIP
jgi:hypothetical protein